MNKQGISPYHFQPMGYKDISHHSMSDLLAPQVSPRLSDLDYSSSTGEFHRSLYQDNCVFDPSLYQPKKSSPSSNQSFYHPTVSRSTSSNRLKNQPTSPTFSFHSDLLQSHKDEPTDNSFEDDYINQANMQTIMEKRRRRRESHNAVERRRRDNINERIQELGTLLPFSVEEGKLNKGTILRKSVEQIRKLQEDVYLYRQRIRELENVLQQHH